MNRGIGQRPPNLATFGRPLSSAYAVQQPRSQFGVPQRSPAAFPQSQQPLPGQRSPFGFPPQNSATDSPDLADFPALGSPVPTQALPAHTPGVGSYASVGGQPQAPLRNGQDSRSSLTADDFPALGGERVGPEPPNHVESGPPGLNGTHFDSRSSLLGALQSPHAPPQQTPGMLNLGPGGTRGAFSFDPSQDPSISQRKLSQPASQKLPHPNGIESHPPSILTPPHPPLPPPPPPATTTNMGPQYPATNSQQVLISPADRWGLLGLISILKQSRESELGFDMSQLGMDVSAPPGSLHVTFTSPFFPSTGTSLPSPFAEPDFEVPKVYPTGTKSIKVEAFTDEVLFILFYAAPRDAFQEIAADYLYQRMWRFHKPTRLWLSRDSDYPHTKMPSGETGMSFFNCISFVSLDSNIFQGTYNVFNVSAENGIWTKERREMTILYSDLEERPYKSEQAHNVIHDAIIREQRQKDLVQQHQLRYSSAGP
ncbi:hypothetical protein DL96DRAFT_1819491 [Flagelloscypha sp. PMI_526]|nr:hypothetical protein DL96DRAFT_1819491 [Flagelloscypha sp. PMI_526]